MLTLWGPQRRFCDRVSRRDFLRVGALGLGGLTLADLLRLRAARGDRSSARVGHHGLPGRRSQPHRHVRPQAGRPRRRAAATSSRSRPTCPASTSANCCRVQAANRRQAGPGPHGSVRRTDAARTGGGLHRLPQGRATARLRRGRQPLPRRRTGTCRATSAWISITPTTARWRTRSTSAPLIGRSCSAARASRTSAYAGRQRRPFGRPPATVRCRSTRCAATSTPAATFGGDGRLLRPAPWR